MFRTTSYSTVLAVCLAMLDWTGCDLGKFDGVVPNPDVVPPPNVSPLLGCNATCHGDVVSPAPPIDTTGGSDPTTVSVGAHRAHLEVAPTWYRQGVCEDCHIVPVAVTDPGHNDTLVPAELTFGPVAGSGGVTPTWNGATCDVWCHGAGMNGGTNTQPSWTASGSLNGACDTCHGYPPPPPHPGLNDCGTCHATMQPGGTTFLDPESHIDGKVDTAANNNVQGCDSCHGANGESAPPNDTQGNTDPTLQTVGAHRAHIGPSDWRRELYCAQCHIVPVDVSDAPHIDGDNVAEVTFDNLNPDGIYDVATATCSNNYCHGPGLASTGNEIWTTTLQLNCDGCHDDGSNGGVNMSGAHDDHLAENFSCSTCHSTVVNVGGVILDPNLHINGLHEVEMAIGIWDPAQRRCANVGCHGDFDWD